jgi:hypothetical protein
MNKKFDASHNSQDRPIVERIAEWLEDNTNISVWLDKWNLIPGEPWQEEIEDALDGSRCCVVFLGANGIGPWDKKSTCPLNKVGEIVPEVETFLPKVAALASRGGGIFSEAAVFSPKVVQFGFVFVPPC